jgi:uncharacterized membrane protein YfcA
MIWLGILALGVLAGGIGGIVGFGGSTILLPALVFAFGPKEAVPIMGVAGVLANLGRVAVWWRMVDWRAAAVYAATGVPAVALGARLFLALDARLVEMLLGVFMLAMVPVRRWFLARSFTIGLSGLAAAGAGVGLLTGLVASTGPLSTPFFLAFGLVKGAFIATEALGSLAIFLTKALIFRSAGALPWPAIVSGVLLGASMIAGTWLARSIVQRMDAAHFRVAMDVMLVLAGIAMIIGANLP